MHRIHVVLAAVALQATAACYPYWSGSALEERVLALENASNENRAQLDELRRDLGARVDQLEETLETLTRSATRTTAEVAAATDDLLRQVQRLRGELAESQFRATEFQQRFEGLERQVAALGGDEALRRLDAQRGLQQIQRPTDKKAFFDLAMGFHDEGNYAMSRQLFQEYIDKWRFDEEAPRAQLLIGDSWFAEGRHREAILAYQKVRETWPTSKYLPDALYKLGLSFEKLGLKDEARQFLQEAAKFSGQDAGKKARDHLRQMK